MNKNLILFVLLGLAGCSGKQTQEVQTTPVQRGTFLEEITEQGTIRAVNSIGISAPPISYRYGSPKITRIVADGTEVEKGDTVLVFDPSEMKKAIVTAQQQLDIASAEYDKMKAMQESAIEDLEADLEIVRINQEIAKINFDQSVFESEITRKEINLKLESANIALERARDQIVNRKKINEQELLQKRLSMNQFNIQLKEANNSLNAIYIVSPSKGIAILRENYMNGQKLKAGDTPGGGKLIELPDLSQMLAEVRINEVDISKITPGLTVEIKADAFSDSTYIGKVTTIANLAQNKNWESRIKVFPIQILIEGVHKSLLPGFTVSCKIHVRELQDVLFIPVEAVFKSQGLEYVYVKSGTGFKRKDVKIGASNTDYVVITEGLEENETVALADPFLNREEKQENGKTK